MTRNRSQFKTTRTSKTRYEHPRRKKQEGVGTFFEFQHIQNWIGPTMDFELDRFIHHFINHIMLTLFFFEEIFALGAKYKILLMIGCAAAFVMFEIIKLMWPEPGYVYVYVLPPHLTAIT
jgi:hypothetical protein